VDLFDDTGAEKLIKALKVRGEQLKRDDIESNTDVAELKIPIDSDRPTAVSKSQKRKIDPTILVALIGVVGTIIAALIGLPILTNSLSSNTPIPASSLTSTIPSSLPLATNTLSRTLTYTPEPRYTIVDKQDVLNIAPNMQTLGQLAKEKYSLEERNDTNGTLTFTIEASVDVPMLWRWFWCATSQNILDENMKAFDVEFVIDDRKIPNDQFAQLTFTNADASLKGWKCFTYETVLRDWKPGEYHLVQTVTLKSNINDGQGAYKAGKKVYDYTVYISP
jgi:hypothetical protein